MSDFFEIAGWIFLSSVKYIVVIIALLANSSRFWLYDLLIVAVGGSIGVAVFTFLGSLISKFFERFSFFRVSYKNLRRVVLVKNGYGLIGLVFLTPLILGVPFGCIITTLFEPDKKKIFKMQLTSVILWSIFLFGVKGIIQFMN